MNIVTTNKVKHLFRRSVDYTGVLCKLEPISATYPLSYSRQMRFYVFLISAMLKIVHTDY